MNRKIVAIGLVVLAAAAAALVRVAVVTKPGDNDVGALSTSTVSRAYRTPGDVASIRQTADASIRSTIAASSLPPDLRRDDEFVRAAGEALAVYLAGDVHDFVAQLQAAGVKSDAVWGSDRGEKIWDGMTHPVRGRPAAFDAMTVIVRKKLGSTSFPPPSFARDGLSMCRAQADPDMLGDVSPLRPDVLVVDVVLPMRPVVSDGSAFYGEFGVTLSRRASDGKWFVIETWIHGRPPTLHAISSPPPR